MGHWTSFFKKSFTLGFYNVLIQGINFATFSVVARFLEASEYGMIALITVFSGFLVIFSDAGLSFAVVREDFDEKFLQKLNTLSITIGLLLTIGLAILASPIAWFYENEALFAPTLFLSIIFTIQATFLISKAKLQKQMDFSKIGLYMAIGQVIVGIGTILMAWQGYSYWALVFPSLIGLLVQGALFYRAAPIKLIWLSPSELKETAITVKSLLSNISGFNMINYWARNADNLLIGKFYGEGALGIYNYAYKLFVLPQNILNNIFSQLILPSFKQLHHNNGNIKAEYMRLLGGISVLLLPIGIPLIIIPDFLVSILFGVKWIEVGTLLPYFGVALLTQPLVAPITPLLILYKKEKILFIIGVSNAVVIVSFIALGASISVLHIAFFYVLSYLVITLPFVTYLSLIKTLKFNATEVIIFWGVKILFSTLLLFAIYLQQQTWVYIITCSYALTIIITERKNLIMTSKLIRVKLNITSS